jgi:hypothetical protein
MVSWLWSSLHNTYDAMIGPVACTMWQSGKGLIVRDEGRGTGRKGTRRIVKARQVRDSRLVVARVQRRGAETGVVSVGRGTWDVGHWHVTWAAVTGCRRRRCVLAAGCGHGCLAVLRGGAAIVCGW